VDRWENIIKCDKPIIHTAVNVYTEGDLIEEFQEQVEELLDTNLSPTVYQVSEFGEIAKETYYVVLSKVRYEDRSGKVVRTNCQFSARKEISMLLRKTLMRTTTTNLP
jgi:hypothetical protein